MKGVGSCMDFDKIKQPEDMTKLPNIGEVLQKQLISVGIMSYQQLKEEGAKQVWLKIQGIDSSACIHRLQALEGAIEGKRKSQLAKETKEDLKLFYQEHKL